MPSLLATHGYHFGIRFELLDLTTIGRSSGCSIQLLDEKVSRLHSTIYAEGTGYAVRDEGSSNGTGLDGELLLEPGELKPGAEVAIGNNLLLYEPTMDIFLDRSGAGAIVLAAAGESEQISEVGVSGLSSSDGLPFQPAGLMAAVARVLASNRNTGFAWLILEALVRGVGAERAAMLQTRGAAGDMKALLTYPAQSRLTIPRPLLQRVLEQGKGLRMEDAIADLKVRGGRTKIETRLGSALCLPVIRRGKLEAVLYLDTQVRGAFRSMPLSVVEDLAILCYPMILRGLKIPLGEDGLAPPKEPIIAESPAMQRVMQSIDQFAGNEAPVLLQGEIGTGREKLAQRLHGRSARRHGPFTVVPCDELTEEQLETELFGYEKGSVPGAEARRKGKVELADCGTVLLREIGDLPPSLQIKVVRMMQEGRVYRQGAVRPVSSDVRVMATSRRDLTRMVRHDEFREDLFRVFSRQRIDVPPLRERKADLVPLIKRIVSEFNHIAGTAVTGLDAEAQQRLEAHPWHSNLWELEQVMHRILVLTAGAEVELATVVEQLEFQSDPAAEETLSPDAIRDVERRLVMNAAQKARGRKSRAARILGVTREGLDRKLVEYGIDLARVFGQTTY